MLVQSVKPRTGTPMEALNFNSHTDSLAVKNLPASLIDLDTVPGAQLIIHSRDGECGERSGQVSQEMNNDLRGERVRSGILILSEIDHRRYKIQEVTKSGCSPILGRSHYLLRKKVCMASTAVDEEEAATWSSILIVDITDLRDSKIKVHHLYQ
ncbi:uncharacterized protein [Physcomitrium patens]|uniref:uncharacterized protein isoform X3 n=1 Tax=Physcomitrium patens TaxID=3218 RepID=UPI003CCD22E3